jgi:hypothetical protein
MAEQIWLQLCTYRVSLSMMNKRNTYIHTYFNCTGILSSDRCLTVCTGILSSDRHSATCIPVSVIINIDGVMLCWLVKRDKSH